MVTRFDTVIKDTATKLKMPEALAREIILGWLEHYKNFLNDPDLCEMDFFGMGKFIVTKQRIDKAISIEEYRKNLAVSKFSVYSVLPVKNPNSIVEAANRLENNIVTQSEYNALKVKFDDRVREIDIKLDKLKKVLAVKSTLVGAGKRDEINSRNTLKKDFFCYTEKDFKVWLKLELKKLKSK